MSPEGSEKQIALALLDDVEDEIEAVLGTRICRVVSDGYDPELDAQCKDWVRRCEAAEAKAPGDREVLAISNTLKAQVFANWQKIQGVRGGHKRSVECYEIALANVEPGGAKEAQLRYRYAGMLVHGVFSSKQKAIENYERAMSLVGPGDKVGLESAKELELLKAKKGGCFIATACTGSADSPEVIVLSRFRDDVLARSPAGRTLISGYYRVSPIVAGVIAEHETLRRLVRHLAVRPLARLVRDVRIGH